VDRVTSSFAHRRPFWWYLPIAPLFFFPWILFRPSFSKLQLKAADTGTRFCLAWLALPLFIFSMISGKQPHYLIPFIPAGALLIGRNIARAEGLSGKTSVKILGGLFLVLGLVALALPLVDLGGDVGHLKQGSTLFAATGLMVAGLFLLLPFRTTGHTVKRVALGTTLVLLFSLVEAKKNFMDHYDIKETAVFIKGKMDEGVPVAHIGKYHGQYQFLGRLEKPIAVIKNRPAEIQDFATNHPGTLFISYPHKQDAPPEGAKIRFSHEYRGNEVVLWQMGDQLP